MQLYKNKKKIMLSKEQKSILAWLFHHAAAKGDVTAYSTWQMLFNERDNEMPDECIAIYDELTLKEKIDVELIFARFISTKDSNKHQEKSFNDWIHYLSYEEV